MKTKTISLTPELITAAFTEWERRYRKDPELFMSEASKLLKDTPRTYGEACTPYFLSIAQTLKKSKRVFA